MRTTLNRVTRSGRLTLVITWIALSLASVAWAVSTPLGASPDEPAHIIKAASVVRGEFVGEPTSAPAVTRVSVPEGIAQASSWTCYAFNSQVSAACLPEFASGFDLVEAETSAGLYDPAYYLAVGWPSLIVPDAELSVLMMRAVSAVISSFFLAFTFTILLRLASPLIAGLAFFAGVTPMVLFLNGAVNPNALEISSGAALTAGLLHVTQQGRGLQTRTVLAVVAVAGFMLANSRGLSPLWMALIGALVIVATPWARIVELLKRWDVRLTLAVLALGVMAAGGWLLATNTLSSMGVFPGAGSTSPAKAFFVMLINRSFDPGIIGVFGWLDTPAPPITYVVWIVLIAAVLIVALVTGRGRLWLAFTMSLATVALVPPIVQAFSVERSGYIWQGRYGLIAVLYCLIFAAVATRSANVGQGSGLITNRLVLLICGAVLIGHVSAMITAIGRYSASAANSLLPFLIQPSWTPPLGSVFWVAMLIVGIVCPLLLWLAAVRDSQGDEVAVVDDEVPGYASTPLAR